MEGRNDMYRQGRTGWSVFRNHEEFQEEDVWAVSDKPIDSHSKVGSWNSSTVAPRRLPAAAQMIPRGNNHSNQEPRLIQQSAPVNIPDWSKIYGTNSKKASGTVSFHGDDVNVGINDGWHSDEDGDDDELDRDMMPPHELIAKKLARSRISSFSVCEGAGRTLKGRDLSRVRNAVLSRTGFLE